MSYTLRGTRRESRRPTDEVNGGHSANAGRGSAALAQTEPWIGSLSGHL